MYGGSERKQQSDGDSGYDSPKKRILYDGSDHDDCFRFLYPELACKHVRLIIQFFDDLEHMLS